MEVLDILPNTPEWEMMRRMKIGSSDTPSICGVDPYRKPSQLWQQKFRGEKSFSSVHMVRGKTLEPIARSMVCKAHGVEYLEMVCQHDEYDWMIASLDGYCIPFNQGIEVKCPSDKTFNKILDTQEIPKNYIYQMQHQMCVTGCDEWYLILFNGSFFEEFKIARSEDIIQEIIDKGEKFYNSLIRAEPI